MSSNEIFLLIAGIVMGFTAGGLIMKMALVTRFKKCIQFWSEQVEIAQKNTASQIDLRQRAEQKARMGNPGPWPKSLEDLNKIIQYLILKRENPSQVIACDKGTAEQFCEFLNYFGTNGVLKQAPHHAQFAYAGYEFIFTEDQETIRRSKSNRIAMDQLDLQDKYANED